jgi:hypothetical protein
MSGMDPQCKTLKKNQETPLCFVIRVEVCCMESVEESIWIWICSRLRVPLAAAAEEEEELQQQTFVFLF